MYTSKHIYTQIQCASWEDRHTHAGWPCFLKWKAADLRLPWVPCCHTHTHTPGSQGQQRVDLSSFRGRNPPVLQARPCVCPFGHFLFFSFPRQRKTQALEAYKTQSLLLLIPASALSYWKVWPGRKRRRTTDFLSACFSFILSLSFFFVLCRSLTFSSCFYTSLAKTWAHWWAVMGLPGLTV